MKILLYLLLFITGTALGQSPPDSAQVMPGTSFTPQWRYSGANASDGINQFRNPLNNKWFSVYSSYQTKQLFAPISGSGFYINNQNSSAQTANFWISGGGRIEGNLLLFNQANVYNSAMAFFGSNPALSPSIFINSGGIKIGTTGNLTNNYTEYGNQSIKVDNGTTLFYQTIQAANGTIALLSDVAAGGITLNQKLYTWTNSFSYSLTAITRDSNDGIVSATLVWPDGSTGVFTTDTSSTDFPGAVDAYHVTYIPSSGPTKTITQSLLTRNTNGAVTAQPILTITP